jgi:2-polyprenyl-3-methyl-5-hydroxy-6-metoxy-1,4-benzoquinol methylase
VSGERDQDRCRVCGSTSVDFRFAARGQDLWGCHHCGFLQVASQPTAKTLDAIYADGYFTSAKYKGDPIALTRENDRRLRLLDTWSAPGATILDAGCSTGDFIVHCKDRYRVYGIDYSAFAIKTAKERNPELVDRLEAGRLEDSTWATRQFDAICLWDVIEHIWDPVPVISDLLQRVQPGGVILMSTPAADSAMARMLKSYWPFMTPPEHLGFFSLSAFKAAAIKVGGCEIVYAARRGKWANLAFIAYKIKRIAPRWFPGFLLWPLQRWPLSRISIYVPTRDILYVVFRRSSSPGATPSLRVTTSGR